LNAKWTEVLLDKHQQDLVLSFLPIATAIAKRYGNPFIDSESIAYLVTCEIVQKYPIEKIPFLIFSMIKNKLSNERKKENRYRNKFQQHEYQVAIETDQPYDLLDCLPDQYRGPIFAKYVLGWCDSSIREYFKLSKRKLNLIIQKSRGLILWNREEDDAHQGE
jgi:hypothetical protein